MKRDNSFQRVDLTLGCLSHDLGLPLLCVEVGGKLCHLLVEYMPQVIEDEAGIFDYEDFPYKPRFLRQPLWKIPIWFFEMIIYPSAGYFFLDL